MLRQPSPSRVALALAAISVVAGAFSATTVAASPAGGDLETGPGVSDDTIKLGVLTDQSGPFAGASLGIAQGRQLFWDARNAEGGVCNRTVEFDVKDHAYNAQNATSLYAAMEPEVLAFDELLGSPMIAALVPTIGEDGVLTMAVSFSSNLLDNPYVVDGGHHRPAAGALPEGGTGWHAHPWRQLGSLRSGRIQIDRQTPIW